MNRKYFLLFCFIFLFFSCASKTSQNIPKEDPIQKIKQNSQKGFEELEREFK